MTGLLVADLILGALWVALKLSPTPDRRKPVYTAQPYDLEHTK